MQFNKIKTLFIAISILSTLITCSVIMASAYEINEEINSVFDLKQLTPTSLTNKSNISLSQGKVVNVKISDDKYIEASVPNLYMQLSMSDLKIKDDLKIEQQDTISLDEFYSHNIDIPLTTIVSEAERIRQEKEEEKAKEATEQTEQTEQVEVGIVKDVPDVRSDKKTYMDYTKITCKSTPQYRLQQLDNISTNDEGFRMYNDDYVVAIGSYYTREIGTRIKVRLDSGKEFYAVVGEQKSDRHTDALHQHKNGNIIEFIVDTNKIPKMCKKMGDMSYAEQAGLTGKVVYIEVLSKIQEDI